MSRMRSPQRAALATGLHVRSLAGDAGPPLFPRPRGPVPLHLFVPGLETEMPRPVKPASFCLNSAEARWLAEAGGKGRWQA